MTQRSILAGAAPTVIIKAGGSVVVRGHDSERVSAETTSRWGLKVEQRSQSEIARARAAIGEHVLFDLHLKLPDLEGEHASDEVIEVKLGGSGEVLVPFASNLKVYAGKNIDVQDIRGQVDAYSGYKMSLQAVDRLGHASAGGSMDIDCQTILGDRVEFSAGSDLRFHVRDLTSAHIRVRDLGGFWEARIGSGGKSVTLKSGGDVTIVTDQKLEPLPPDYIFGKIEKPSVEE